MRTAPPTCSLFSRPISRAALRPALPWLALPYRRVWLWLLPATGRTEAGLDKLFYSSPNTIIFHFNRGLRPRPEPQPERRCTDTQVFSAAATGSASAVLPPATRASRTATRRATRRAKLITVAATTMTSRCRRHLCRSPSPSRRRPPSPCLPWLPASLTTPLAVSPWPRSLLPPPPSALLPLHPQPLSLLPHACPVTPPGSSFAAPSPDAQPRSTAAARSCVRRICRPSP